MLLSHWENFSEKTKNQEKKVYTTPLKKKKRPVQRMTAMTFSTVIHMIGEIAARTKGVMTDETEIHGGKETRIGKEVTGATEIDEGI